MKVTIRKANPQDDAKAISKLIREELQCPVSASDTAKALTRLCVNTHNRVFVAAVDDVVVGFLHVSDYDSVLLTEPMKQLRALAVAGSYRRIGIGRTLLQRAERWAAENGASGILVDYNEAFAEAEFFYRSCGYTAECREVFCRKLFPIKRKF